MWNELPPNEDMTLKADMPKKQLKQTQMWTVVLCWVLVGVWLQIASLHRTKNHLVNYTALMKNKQD
jgi:hypothetical protein